MDEQPVLVEYGHQTEAMQMDIVHDFREMETNLITVTTTVDSVNVEKLLQPVQSNILDLATSNEGHHMNVQPIQVQETSKEIGNTALANLHQYDVISVCTNSQTNASQSESLQKEKKKSIFQRLSSSLGFKKRKRSESQASESSPVMQMLDFVQEDVTDIKTAIESLTEAVSKITVPEKKSNEVDEKEVSVSAELNARLVLLRSAKSVSEMLIYGNDFIPAETEDGFMCQVCQSDLNKGNRNLGVLKYDFSKGSDFQEINQTREFINLKTRAIKHLKSVGHNEMLRVTNLHSQYNDLLIARNYKVGIHLGIQAYKLLKTGGSHSSFPLELSCLSAESIDVGTINHSRKFCAEFAKSVKCVLQSRLQTLINSSHPATGRPVPLSVIADKITPNRQTMQIVGFHALVGSKFSPLVAGVPALEGCDGLSVTKCLRTGLSSLNISTSDLAHRLLGGAFDGEYFNLNVPKHLGNMMLIGEDERHWYTYQWDPAHILELAEKDSRTKSQAMQRVMSSINNVSKQFSYGKSFKELLMEAEEEALNFEVDGPGQSSKPTKARVPCHFSDTRFATYSADVLRKWHNNYQFYYRILNRRQDDNLDKIDNAHFVFTSGALIDAYTVIGDMSNALQKPTLTHWEVQGISSHYTNKLHEMIGEIDSWLSGGSDSNNEKLQMAKSSTVFPTLSNILTEVDAKGEFKGCAVLAKKHVVQGTRGQLAEDACQNSEYLEALASSSKLVKDFLQKFTQNFATRTAKENERNPLFRHIDTVFDLKSIINSNSLSQDVENSLNTYFKLAQKVGSIEKTVSFDSIREQYEIFSNRVKEVYSDLIINVESSTLANPVLRQCKMYANFLNTPDLYKDIPDFLHLALTAVSRTHCEAVVEGMGSVLGFHSQNRTRLCPETVETETIIRWQGPHPSLSKSLVEKALDNHFVCRKKWNFCVKWDRASHFARSQVLTRIDKEAKESLKIPFE